MPVYIVKGDITKMPVDAIVNAANSSLLGGGGVDGAIHRAAGIELLKECQTLGGCETGDAKITKGYGLPAKHVIHTVGPIWRGGSQGEEQLLKSCYVKSLELAKQNNCESIAFPLISSGIYGYPKDEAFAVAYESVKSNVGDDMTAYIVIFDGQSRIVGGEYLKEIDACVADWKRRNAEAMEKPKCDFDKMSNYAASIDFTERRKKSPKPALSKIPQSKFSEEDLSRFSFAEVGMANFSQADFKKVQLDESFSQALLRIIDERGYTDAECYKKANVDRKLFSKIRSDDKYHPSKYTALAFAIALELSLEETNDLLRKAGYTLSRSSMADIIIEYFISNNVYDIYEINKALFAYDQRLLGC